MGDCSVIRQYRDNDILEVIEIEKASFNHSQWNQEDFDQFMDDGGSGVVYDDFGILGFLFYEVIDGSIYIADLAVLPEYRNRGIAKKMFDYVVKNASCYLHVDAKSESVGFYQKMGFAIIEQLKDFYDDGIDAYLMERP